MKMKMEHLWNDFDSENQSTPENVCSNTPLSTENLVFTDPGGWFGVRNQNPA